MFYIDLPRFSVSGVYIDDIINEEHPAYGEKGLFTNRKWNKYEVISNYCGIICEPSVINNYVARLYHDIPSNETISINASNCGNELRYINDYRNISN